MSSIDGRQVHYRGRDDWRGLVIGDDLTPGNVRVAWTHPKRHIGAHSVNDLVVDDAPPSQEQLASLL